MSVAYCQQQSQAQARPAGDTALETGLQTGPGPLRTVEFGVYCAIAMLIHATIAIPAVIARFVTDITLGYSVFQAVKPKKRSDLY